MTLAENFGTGQVFWSMLWFFLWILWFWLLFTVITDVFRSPDLDGWGKALWVIFVIILPYLGVFVYLIARGRKMQEHAVHTAQESDAAARQYIQSVAAEQPPSTAEQISKLSELHASGALTDAEYQQAKAKALA